MPQMPIFRFAPSPTGALHLGNGYSALYAFDRARQMDGSFLLRVEDIDQGRCRPEHEAAMLADLAWLGLTWEQPVRRQSEHMDDYAAALAKLSDAGLTYPCFCTRKDIAREIAAGIRKHCGTEFIIGIKMPADEGVPGRTAGGRGIGIGRIGRIPRQRPVRTQNRLTYPAISK